LCWRPLLMLLLLSQVLHPIAPSGAACPHLHVHPRRLRVSVTCRAAAAEPSPQTSQPSLNDDEGDEDVPEPGKPLRVERLLANLGYGKRREMQALVKQGRVLKNGVRLRVRSRLAPACCTGVWACPYVGERACL
jgi:hypothetical protein